ncbi:MAG: M48 family metallopeptidase [Elusimicrobia bacterium]|nr:M48 family metallopeptidase [Candidatus Liberimonas magnetica]
MNTYLIIILAIIIGGYLLDLLVETLNLNHASPQLPEEFIGFYDAQKYKTSQEYLKDNTKFDFLSDGFFTALTIIFIMLGGFNFVDGIARSFGFAQIFSGLIFAGMLLFGLQVLKIPFSLYETFVIEEKYGFNKTTLKTFFLDILKSWVLLVIIGGLVFSGVIWFFARFGALAWLYSWLALTVFQIFLIFIAPVIIMPLFNKFIPLEEGELKTTLEKYAKEQDFKMKGLFKMDGSKRSTKSNAFFTGFGKYRRIVLFDTLIEKHSVDELVSVLAHEMGHYKLKHILKSIITSIITTGVMFFILSLFINNAELFKAFKMENISVYASLFFFGFLYAPINMIFSVITSIMSRVHEFEADAYAVHTYKKAEAMINALKKLSVNNLSNLTPHPLKVFLEYSHPPVLERIKAIRAMQN